MAWTRLRGSQRERRAFLRGAMPTESAEQQAVIEWSGAMRDRFPVLCLLHASQAGARVSWKQAKRLKREGMCEGIPDLYLPVARQGFHGLYLEMKRRKGGRVSQAQLWWHVKLREQGYRVEICRGAEEAIAVLFQYLAVEQWASERIATSTRTS